MYIYELARELDAEPRELIECAAVEEMGHFSPNTKLSQEQILQLRESYVRSRSNARGSLFSGGSRPSPSPPAPPAAEMPAPEPDGYDSPLLKPIHDPGEHAGNGWGGPLSFDPSGPGLGGPLEPPGPSASASSASTSPSTAPRWDEPTSWDPFPSGSSIGGATGGAAPPPTPSSPVDYSRGPGSSIGVGLSEAEYDRRFRLDDGTGPKADPPSGSRPIVIGVLGVVFILAITIVLARELDIIGPGSERTCTITESPDPDGEGVIKDVSCVDGYGRQLSHEVLREDSRAVEFGASEDGSPTRVVRMDDFCRGATAFLDFHRGFQSRVVDATSMVELGKWYDENDGFGSGGHVTMVGSFGRSGPNPRVVALGDYLGMVEDAARARTVPQAQMLSAAAEQTFSDNILEVENFARRNC